jgi:xylose isomerase
MPAVKADAAFDMFQILGVPFFCFHDADVRPEGRDFAENTARLDEIVDYFAAKMEATGVKLLWGTANLFSAPPLHVGRRDEPRSRRLRVCGRDDQDLHGCDAPLGRRKLRPVGRARRV